MSAVGSLGRKLAYRSGDFLYCAADGDAEHPLAALQKINDFFRRGALVDRRAVTEQRDTGQVVHSTTA